MLARWFNAEFSEFSIASICRCFLLDMYQILCNVNPNKIGKRIIIFVG